MCNNHCTYTDRATGNCTIVGQHKPCDAPQTAETCRYYHDADDVCGVSPEMTAAIREATGVTVYEMTIDPETCSECRFWEQRGRWM